MSVIELEKRIKKNRTNINSVNSQPEKRDTEPLVFPGSKNNTTDKLSHELVHDPQDYHKTPQGFFTTVGTKNNTEPLITTTEPLPKSETKTESLQKEELSRVKKLFETISKIQSALANSMKELNQINTQLDNHMGLVTNTVEQFNGDLLEAEEVKASTAAMNTLTHLSVYLLDQIIDLGINQITIGMTNQDKESIAELFDHYAQVEAALAQEENRPSAGKTGALVCMIEGFAQQTALDTKVKFLVAKTKTVQLIHNLSKKQKRSQSSESLAA